jgi:hypothetical protein
MRKKGALSLLPVLVAAVLAACSDDGGGGSLAALGVDDGASKGVSKSATVSGKEDVRIALKTGALMDVPAGAVSKNVELTMERPADTKAVQLVERFKKMPDRIASAPYVLKPHGTKFQQEVTLTLPLAKEGKREVSVAWLEDENDTEWKFLGKAKTDAAGTKAEVKIKHFSVVVIVEDASDLEPVDDIDEQPAADAGTPVEDAGASEASVEADAGAVARVDAGDEVPQDAGNMDAAMPDASVLDASMADSAGNVVDAAGGELDAALPPDTGTAVPDASVPPDATDDADADAEADADAGGTSSLDQQYAELVECDVVTDAGAFSAGGMSGVSPFDGPYELCYHNCISSAGSCSDKQLYRCDLGGFSNAVYECMYTCPMPTGSCPNDVSTTALACDGVIQCPDAADEQGCDPRLFFTCQDSSRVAMTQRCDDQSDCPSGEDEANCFVCDTGITTVAPHRLCDGLRDCDDGADEQGCAQVACPVPL